MIWVRATGLRVMLLISLMVMGAVLPIDVWASPVLPMKHVLIVHGVNQDYPTAQQFTRGVQEKLETYRTFKTVYSHEYLELTRYTDQAYSQALTRFLKQKYAQNQPDVIIVEQKVSSVYILEQGQEVFPGVPVIVAGDDVQGSVEEYLRPKTAAIKVQSNIKARLELILQLQPDVETIYIVAGNSNVERNILNNTMGETAVFGRGVEFVYLNQLPFAQLLERVGGIQGKAAVLFFLLFEDAAGQGFIPAQVLREIAGCSPVPVYAAYSSMLGSGAVGGYMFSYQLLGGMAADIAVAMLQGQEYEDGRVQYVSVAQYIFDWRQLQRWGIDEGRLPAGSLVEYKEFSVWETHRGTIIAVAVTLLLQGLLIAGLLVNRARRRRIEKMLKSSEEELLQLKQELEYKVEMRTQDLLVMNEELQAVNSESVKLNEDLERLKQQAEEASQAKSSFLANISHEIRTPMNAILGMTYLLQQTKLERQQADYLTKLQIAGKVLLNIINEVLDFSKIEAGKLDIEKVPFRLTELLEQAADMLKVKTQEKGLALAVVQAKHLPAVICGDPLRLNQILMNLLSNAVKFTERGGITVNVTEAGRSADRVCLQFAVQDTGIGLTPQEQERLFQAFSQVESSITRRYGGTGLGLAIAKRLVNLMDGEIWVESQAGCGSTFYFTACFGLGGEPVILETGNITPALSILRQKMDLQGVRVLLVDDNEMNLEVAGEILQGLGAVTSKALNGQEALAQLAQRDFDAVLMDVHMPVMNGYETTRAVRAQPKWDTLPIIALTASAMYQDREEAMRAGMNDFIKKPINAEELAAVLTKWMRPELMPLDLFWFSEEEEGGLAGEEAALPLLDQDQVLGRLEGNRRLQHSILEKFNDKAADILVKIAAAAADGKWDDVRFAVHDLKGAAGLVGALRLQHAAKAMEERLQTDEGQGIAAAYKEIEEIARMTAAEIRTYLAGEKEKMPTQHLPISGLEELGGDAVSRLHTLLAAYDAEAAVLFADLCQQEKLGILASQQEHLKQCIENYNFEAAAVIVEQLMAQLSDNER